MFLFHIALALELIALTAATALCVWSSQPGVIKAGCAKFISVLVIIAALFSIGCTLYCGIKECQHGHMTHDTQNLNASESQTMSNNHNAT